MNTPLLALACLVAILWLFTLCRIATSRYHGRSTKRRRLLNVGSFGLPGSC